MLRAWVTRWWLAGACLVWVRWAAAAGNAPLAAAKAQACREAITRVERSAGIPRLLLSAITLAESGRWNAETRESFAWPWTVSSGKNSWHYPTKEAALAGVRKLQAQGVKNIDVGCMQINLQHHREAFDSLDEAFDPDSNVTYAATFLKKLHADLKSWPQAVARYHSATPEYHIPYRAKVERLWDSERRRDATERSKILMAAYRERRLASEQSQQQRAITRTNVMSQLATR